MEHTYGYTCMYIYMYAYIKYETRVWITRSYIYIHDMILGTYILSFLFYIIRYGRYLDSYIYIQSNIIKYPIKWICISSSNYISIEDIVRFTIASHLPLVIAIVIQLSLHYLSNITFIAGPIVVTDINSYITYLNKLWYSQVKKSPKKEQ